MELNDLTQSISAYLPHFFATLPLALIIILGTMLINLIVGRALVLLARRTNLNEADLLPIQHVLKWLLRVIALILILSVFGLQIGGIWAVLSTILGLVAIGFVAMWSLISHTTATMLILFLRPFQIGDDIELAGEPVKGRVVDLNFFFTTLIDHDGLLQQVPNNLFFQKTLKRRKNIPPVRLAAQLNSREPAAVELPPPPATPALTDAAAAKKPDPLMNLPDPQTIDHQSRPAR